MKKSVYAIGIGILTAGLLSVSAVVAAARAESVLEERDAALTSRFEASLAELSSQISIISGEVSKLSGESKGTLATVKELQNRKPPPKEKTQDELMTEAVAKVSPSVVSIAVTREVLTMQLEYKDFGGNSVPVYGQGAPQTTKISAGTGFIVSSDGYIVTNKHVTSDTEANYTVTLSNDKQVSARIVYVDPNDDIAILKISGSGYKKASLGSSAGLKLGQSVIAIGNALGEYGNSASIGIVSGLDRTIEASDGIRFETLSGIIQTDAAVNLGNSGGPLINLQGEVVGVNVATVVGSSNISFSIPIDRVKKTLRSVVGI